MTNDSIVVMWDESCHFKEEIKGGITVFLSFYHNIAWKFWCFAQFIIQSNNLLNIFLNKKILL